MHIEEPVTTVILLGATKPEPNLEEEMEAYGMRVRWAQTIKDATELLNSMVNRTVVLTELSVKDGNWRDLLEVVRCSSIPVVLMSPASTAELWWDALDCGVDDIVPAPISASQLCEYVQKGVHETEVMESHRPSIGNNFMRACGSGNSRSWTQTEEN